MALADPLRRHLRAKVIALIAAILVLGFGVLVILNIQREQRLLVAANHETADLLATSIVSSIENGMLQARPDIIRELVYRLKTELKDVRHLDVFRRNGVEAFTDLETLETVNRIAGLDAEVVEKGGEVMVGPETAERIKSHYVLEDRGEHRLKNVSQPVRVCRLVPPGVYRQVA